MANFFAKFGLKLLIGIVTIYAVFFMRIGNRTLFKHGIRIARTPEARELGSSIVGAMDSATSAVTRRIGNSIGGSDDR